MKLSERVRAGSEAAPWVVDEILKMEQKQDMDQTNINEMRTLLRQCRALVVEHAWTGVDERINAVLLATKGLTVDVRIRKLPDGTLEQLDNSILPFGWAPITPVVKEAIKEGRLVQITGTDNGWVPYEGGIQHAVVRVRL